ncbi:MAG: cation-translocating P-type ATPase [Cyanobacteriota bacterium]|nr:cation-translocating P-type ATPase [Cyanobacteriota bacterium]
MAWHSLDGPACLAQLRAGPDGLTTAEAARRLADGGPNRLELAAGRSSLRILWDQFSNIMLIMLLAVALVSGILDRIANQFPKDAIAIVLIVVLNAVLGYLQESRAQKALLALRQMAQPMVPVRRDSHWRRIASEELVPGDLIRLEAGDRVPADARLLEAAELGLREAALTGEAEVVVKQPSLLLDESTPVLERQNCLFQGTEVARGRGTAVVTATGMATELGQIAELINQAGGEATPLQERLDGLANVLVASSLALVGVVVLGGWLLGQNPLNLLEVALSMAVAIVPEGLPAVITVTLAIGTQRMVQRAALIRRLPAVEALGSVTVICTDKTGTLTQNRQVVQELRAGTVAITVGGHGYEPVGAMEARSLAAPGGAHSGLVAGGSRLLLQAGVLCSDAELRRETDGRWEVLGDPTEGALVVVAAKAGIDSFELRSHCCREAEIPFSSERQLMAVWVQDSQGDLQAPLGQVARGSRLLLISKGAPEVIIGSCDRWLDGSGVVAMADDQRQWWLDQARALAATGLRVLAFGCAPHHPSPDHDLSHLILLGLMAQLDPARPEVPAAVARCREAGIRPVMITGDHPLTARAIATGIGLVAAGGEAAEVVLGRDLDTMDGASLARTVNRCSVYARVAPDQKLRIVKALQGQRQVVAMTGDGVNDAPALKQAHIGVAMGITGTEVSKEAADMVLLDDNFATIVNAVEEGRLVYANIRRFVKYILGSNVGELITIAAAPLVGLVGAPMTPLQILWMNLVTDGVPALALALEPGEAGLMQRSPAAPGESIFARGVGRYILRVGLVFALITIALMVLASRTGAPWKTMVFTTLCLAQMGHALAARSDRPLIQINPFSNPWLLGAVLLTTALQLLLLYVPTLAQFFGTVPLSAADLALCVGFSLLFFLFLELDKVVHLWRLRSSSDA